MNYIEILSENDITLLQKQSMILLESNSYQLYEVKLIKKIKDVLSQKFKGSISKLKKILSQSKIKIKNFISFIAKNIKSIKNIKILDIQSLNKEYTKRFSKILNNYITQTNESKKSLVNIFFERNNTEIVRLDDRDKNVFKKYDSLDIYIPDDPGIKDQIKNIDIDKSGDKIRKDLESDKQLGFANNLLQKLRQYEKPVKFVLAIVTSVALVHSATGMSNNIDTAEPAGIVQIAEDGTTAELIPTDAFEGGSLDGGDVIKTEDIRYSIFDPTLAKDVEKKFGDIVKTVKTGAYFLYDSKTNKEILKIANQAYKEFNDSKKEHYKFKTKVNKKDFTLLITQESGDNYSILEKEIKDWLKRQESNLEKNEDLKYKLEKSYNDCKAMWKKGTAAGVACANLSAKEMSFLTEYPVMISKNNKQTIRHESGHTLNDSISVSKVVKNILRIITDTEALKKRFGKDVIDKNGEISTIKFQEVMLGCIKIIDKDDKDIRDGSIESMSITPKIFEDLSDDAQLEIKQYIEVLMGQFLFDGTIEINKETNKLKLKSAYEDSDSWGIKKLKMNTYFNRYNERRQNTKDVLNAMSSLDESISSEEQSLLQDLKGFIKSYDVDSNSNFDIYESFKNNKQSIPDIEKENVKKIIYKIKALADSTKSDFSTIFSRFDNVYTSIKSSDLASSLTFTGHHDHDHHDHDHQHESFARLKEKVYNRILIETYNIYT